MAKKDKIWELNRKQYLLIRKMDHQEMQDYLNAVYEDGIKAGYKEGQAEAAGPQFDTEKAMELISQIKGVGKSKLDAIHRALMGAAEQTKGVKAWEIV